MYEFLFLMADAAPVLEPTPQLTSWIQSVFLVFAIVGTSLVILQFLLACLGFLDLDSVDVDVDDIDTDIDADGDIDGGDADGDSPTDLHGSTFSLAQFFSVRSLVGFSAFFGLVGLWGLSSGINLWVTLGIAFASGCLASFCITKIMKAISSMHSNGNFQIQNAIGKTGTVYTPISPARTATGKVQIIIDGQTEEFEALTDHTEMLTTGNKVVVLKILGGNTFLVQPIDSNDAAVTTNTADSTK